MSEVSEFVWAPRALWGLLADLVDDTLNGSFAVGVWLSSTIGDRDVPVRGILQSVIADDDGSVSLRVLFGDDVSVVVPAASVTDWEWAQ